MKKHPKVAYFSMEFALSPEIPNFAGGLGVLASDIMMSGADLKMPMIGVSLIYHQSEESGKSFDPSKHFKALKETVEVSIEDRKVKVGVFEHRFHGLNNNQVILYLLCTNHPENKPWDRDITKNLYAMDAYTRLCQEVVLGIGGVKMLRKLGYDDIDIFHMNEGHAAFLTFQLLKEMNYDYEEVKKHCRFTTHTPIPAGHDRFSYPLARKVIGEKMPWEIERLAGKEDLHTTKLALSMSQSANAVSQRHTEVCHQMFPKYDFLGITNGVHHRTWVGKSMTAFYDKVLAGWKEDPSAFSKALKLDTKDLMSARKRAKKELLDKINTGSNYLISAKSKLNADDLFDPDTLTITFSRRFVPYKRPMLLFQDLDRLREMGHRQLQIIFSGTCHEGDHFCNNVISQLKHHQKMLRGQIRLAIMEDRNLDTSLLLVTGSDVWLNNPEPPLEASGTSGMKAAMNGCVNLSVPDGWWIEAYEQDKESGWSFGHKDRCDNQADAEDLYKSLEEMVDLYYNHPDQWAEHVKHSIALGAAFNTHRCIQEYEQRMWT